MRVCHTTVCDHSHGDGFANMSLIGLSTDTSPARAPTRFVCVGVEVIIVWWWLAHISPSNMVKPYSHSCRSERQCTDVAKSC